jgi:subtilisin-like proprotein convertase family protein|nr:proprotein convertase P-domain-containing protein [Kofleriaceae bacterium]
MIRAPWLVAGAAALCAGVATPVHADVLHSTREQPLVEISHTVDITLADGVAIYKVRRVFSNPGKLADEAGLAIDLPSGAAATGLRIRAHDKWFDGDLMDRERAAALYHELTGLGAYAPKDPALLQWLWADKLYLQVFPVMPGGASTVEYTLTVPTRYANGKYVVSYPRVDASKSTADNGLALATPIVTVHPAWAASQPEIDIDGKRALADTPVVLSPPAVADWQAQVGAEPDASYVASTLAIADSSHTRGTFSTATIDLDVTHTYIGDLRLELVTPQGKTITLHDRKGGTENDIKGTRTIELPAGTTAAGTWRLVASDHAALDTGSIDRWSLTIGDTTATPTDTPMFIPDAPESASDAGVASISVAAPTAADQPMWTIRVGRAVASDHHAFTRLEIDSARELVHAPKHAQVVFVLDASYSMTEPGLQAQLAVVRAYLAHVPDAEVELVAARRAATRVFGSFVRAADLDRALADATARGAFALGNGSSLDAAAQLAAKLVAARRGPRRVVMFTDELVREGLDGAVAQAAFAALPADTIVHVVVPRVDGDDRMALARDDAAVFAPLATKHHGIYVDLTGAPTGPDKHLEPLALELVRPTRIEHLAVTGITDDHDAPQVPAVLHEGDGVRAMWLADTAPQRLVVTGMLWSDPVRADIAATAAFSRDTAAFVFGADRQTDLAHDEMLRLAIAGGAVSPVTSYVAFEPGTRPSPLGLDYGGTGYGDGFGLGSIGTVGHGGGATRIAPDLHALVDAAACLRDTASADVSLEVETTRDEVVDVRNTGAASPRAACLVEAVWQTRLDSRFYLNHETFDVAWSAEP